MSDKSAIEWTDATWNPVRGCTRVSPGCGGPGKAGGCYAEKIAARFSDPGQAFHGFAERRNGEARWTGKLALIEEQLTLPMRWKRPRRIFVNSMSDLFHENLSDEAIDRVFAVMALCPQHTFQVLTKRADRMRSYMTTQYRHDKIGDAMREIVEIKSGFPCVRWPLPNVWLGVSTERQQEADERIPLLLQTPAAVRFISAEPLLGPIDLTELRLPYGLTYNALRSGDVGFSGRVEHWAALDWVIVGGESGSAARPMHPDWARSLRDQCAEAGVPFFFKQWGEYRPSGGLDVDTVWKREQATVMPDGRVREWQPDFPDARLTDPQMRGMTRLGKKAAGRLLDGKEHNEFPRPEARV